LTVPAGSGDLIRERLLTTSANELNALQWHLVKRGETMATIARKLGVSRIDLAEANYLSATARVAAGQKLLIPRMPSAALLARGGADVTTTADGADATPAVFEDPPADESPRLVHRVRAGETLFSIAKKYQTSVESLRAVNNLRSTTLKVGARLIVQANRAITAQQQ
jgi:membrane-bound lytic murein transglycosylase D